jgi:hypothetical protein
MITRICSSWLHDKCSHFVALIEAIWIGSETVTVRFGNAILPETAFYMNYKVRSLNNSHE